MRIVTIVIMLLAVAAPALAQATHAQELHTDGAIHALTGRHHHRHHWRHHVTIPRYVHHIRRFGILLPPGTTRPGPSRTFIPAR